MPAFTELNWDYPDVWAIVVGRGVAAVESHFEARCDAWLLRNGYKLFELSFAEGISPAVSKLAELLQWEAQFGYRLDPNSRNLAALRDGFEIEEPSFVLRVSHFDRAWSENEEWCRGLLSIISEHSIRQLCLGERFFAFLSVSENSNLLGQCYEELSIPSPFRFRGAGA